MIDSCPVLSMADNQEVFQQRFGSTERQRFGAAVDRCDHFGAATEIESQDLVAIWPGGAVQRPVGGNGQAHRRGYH